MCYLILDGNKWSLKSVIWPIRGMNVYCIEGMNHKGDRCYKLLFKVTHSNDQFDKEPTLMKLCLIINLFWWHKCTLCKVSKIDDNISGISSLLGH